VADAFFPEYRDYRDQWIRVNDAVMAFLTGAQIARQTLALTTGSTHTLAEILPAVPYVQRLNLPPDRAIEVLGHAEEHLGAMAVPYLLAIHEDFVSKTVIPLFVEAGAISKTKASKLGLHKAVQHATRHALDEALIRVHDVLWQLRNCVVHAGGACDQRLVNARERLGPEGEKLWEEITGTPPYRPTTGEVVRITIDDIIVTLAVVKRLSRDINATLQTLMPRSWWADQVIRRSEGLGGHWGSPPVALRRLRGLARTEFRPIGLADSELSAAATRAGRQAAPKDATPERQ
jgi:hypothetical protein